MFEHLVDQPQDAVTDNPLRAGQLTKLAVTGQQNPGVVPRESKGEAVGYRKRPIVSPVTESEGDPVAVQLFHPESELDQGRSTMFLQFLSVQQIRHDEDERQAEADIEERPTFRVDENGCIGDQNLHDVRSYAGTASRSGGSSTRRFSS